MRAFVALDIANPDVLDSLISFQRELSMTGADLKLVERENLHYTLRFLGEISEAQALSADQRLRSLRLTGGTAAVVGVGAFPSPSRPSVIWVGVADEDRQKVGSIAEEVIAALAGMGERDDRPFQAHLTVARVRSPRNKEGLASALKTNAFRDFGVFRLDSIRLKSSQLTPRGPIYKDVGVYPLV